MNFINLKQNLENKGYIVSCFENGKDAVDYLQKEISNKTVGIGGSVTVDEIGLFEAIKDNNQVFWHWKDKSNLSWAETLHNASIAEIYITSANGVAESGEIINIDGTGNRVAATMFGHKKVYFVIGKNKIAETYDEALFRARNIAAVLNAKRLNKETPCVKLNKCIDCNSPQRICRGLFTLWQKPTSYECEVILINEDLGY